MKKCVVRERGGWNEGWDEGIDEWGAQILQSDLLRMLHGDDNGVHTLRHSGTLVEEILASDLCL